ncbi:MAG: hypothetical protein HQK49_22825 [Oligoflexia bacterium]|nr:hypothetical protein [Oligoflexia bacterium]
MKKHISTKNSLIIISILIILLTSSCASVHPGYDVLPTKEIALKNISISSEFPHSLRSENYLYATFTFENMGNDWTQVKDVKIDLGDEKLNRETQILLGAPLNAWANGINLKSAVDDYNRQLLYTMIYLGGMGVAIAGGMKGNSGTAMTGLATSTAALGLSVADSIRGKLLDIENTSSSSSNNYLINSSFLIPPKMFIRKWIVLYNPHNEFPDNFKMNIRASDDKVMEYLVIRRMPPQKQEYNAI